MQRGSGRPSGNTIRVEGWDGWAYTMRNSERLAWVEHLGNRVVENRYPQLGVWASSAREDNMAVGVLDDHGIGIRSRLKGAGCGRSCD